MLRTIFIIIISIVASAMTTAGILYRYTKPVDSAKSTYVSPSRVASEDRQEPGSLIQGMAGKLLVPAKTEGLINTPDKSSVLTVPEADVPVAQQRYFDHELLVKDMSLFSGKLQKFNEILSGEIQRLKSNAKTQP